MNNKAYLLINLGTPEAPTRRSVKKYLQTFLMDERVIALPTFIRWILVYGIIAPFRSGRSAHAYQQIWTPSGSPLAVHSQHLIEKLRNKLPKDVKLAFAMRYGEPSIQNALKQLADCDEIVILPLYPQYASATNASSTVAVFDYFKQQQIIPNLRVIRDFYQHPAYIQALSESIKPYLKQDYHLLLSYHGLPENQLEKIGCRPVCQSACSDEIKPGNACYRQQCFLTSKQLATSLKLTETEYSISFQSRLGKTPWIKPYTDEMLNTLREKGIKSLLIACPAFVADCLETLEEIGIQCKQQWLELGGEDLQLIPCLNDQDKWVDSLIQILD
jgi:ferrochelatase